MESRGQIKSLFRRRPNFRRIAGHALDIIFPPPDNTAWQSLRYLDAPCCDCCGYPFEYEMGTGFLCAKCTTDRPAYDKARAAFQYTEKSAPLVLAFKHGGKTVNLKRFGQQMVRAGRSFWPEAEMLIPVPLHRQRLRRRHYNQAALLAGMISKQTEIPMETDLLLRHRATASQGAQTAKGRFRNVRGAFSISDKDKVKDKVVILIDDVFTTGATLEACTRALRRAGAQKIYAITLARVVKDQEITT